jgi:membrane-bound ClpP family serine protease
VLDQPAVVLLAAALAAVFFVLEVALPTAGVAGTASAVAVAIAGIGIAQQDADWWPLALVPAAMAVWAALVARRRAPLVAQVLAGGVYAGGAIGFALANEDGLALAVAVATSLALPAAFPRLCAAAERLVDLPAQVGMESFAGRIATVASWDAGRGTVVLEGVHWSARGDGPFAEGDEVNVVGHDRMTLLVGAKLPA